MKRISQIIALMLLGCVTSFATTYTVTRLDKGTDVFGTTSAGGCALAPYQTHPNAGGPAWATTGNQQGMLSIGINEANNGVIDTILFDPSLTGTLDLGASTYRLCADNVVIDGNGADVLIQSNVIGLFVAGTNNEIKNLRWATNSTNEGAVSLQANGNILRNCVFESGNLWIGHVSAPTLQVYDCTVDNVQILDGDLQIVGDDNIVDNCTVSHNLVLGNLSIGLEGNAERNIVTDCIVGPNAGNTSQYLVIGDDNISTNVDLIGQGVIIRGNNNIYENSEVFMTKYPQEGAFLLSSFAGIEISTGANRNTIQNNVLTTNLTASINDVDMPLNGISVIAGSDNDTIRNNNVIGFFNGIKMEDSDGGWVEANIVRDSKNHGVFIVTDADGNEVLDNRTFNGDLTGISIHSSKNNKVYRNVSYGNGFNGLAFEVSASSNVFSENILFNNSRGIELWQANGNEMYLNTIGLDTLGNIAANGAGVVIHGSSSNNILGSETEGNVIVSNGGDGVTIDGATSTGNTIRGNNTSCNVGPGINHQNDGNDNYGQGLITVDWGGYDPSELSGGAATVGDIVDVYIADTACHEVCTGESGNITTTPLSQGMVWVASVIAVSDGSGGAEWSYAIPGGAALSWENAIVTATHPSNGNTSEFSTCAYEVNCIIPADPTLVTSNLEFCEGSSLTIEAVLQPTYQYSWYLGNVYVGGGVDASSIVLDQPGSYSLVIADPNDTLVCTKTLEPIEITENANPVITSISPVDDATICFGEQGVGFSSVATGDNAPLNYLWTAPTGASVLSGQGTSDAVIDFTTTAVGPAQVNLRVTDAKGCVGDGTPLDVTIVANPEILAHTGPDEACLNGAAETVSVDLIAGATYAWTVLPASSVGTLSTTNEQEIIPSEVGPVTISVSITSDANGCASDAPYTAVEFRVKPLPTVSLDGNITEVCENNTASFTAISSISGSTYDWTVTDAVQDIADGPATIDVTFAGTSAKIEVVATADGCPGAVAELDVTVIELPETTPIDVSDDSICLDQTGVTFTVDAPTGTAGSEYFWSANNGVTLQGTGNVRTGDFSAATPGIATIKVIEVTGGALGCRLPDSTEATLELFGTPVINGTITTTSPDPTCNETGITYSVTAETGYTYTWTVPNGATITSGDVTSNAITVDLADQNGQVTVTPFNEAGCEGSPISLEVNLSGCNLKAAIEALDAYCIGDDIIEFRNISVGDAIDSVRWQFGIGATPQTSTEDVVVVTYAVAGDYDVTLIAYEGTASDTAMHTVTVNPKPNAANLQLEAPTNVCPDAQGVEVKTIGAYTATSTYNWIIDPSNGASISSKEDTTAILLDFARISPVTVTVIEENEFGCKDTSEVATILLYDIPEPFTVDGPTDLCQFSENSFTVNGGNGGTFVWTMIPDTAGYFTSTALDSSIVGIVLDSTNANQAITISVREDFGTCAFDASSYDFPIVSRPLPVVTDLTGDTIVCTEEGYGDYRATSDIPVAYFNWSGVSATKTSVDTDSARVRMDYNAGFSGGAILVRGVTEFGCESQVPAVLPVQVDEVDNFSINTGLNRCEGSDNEMSVFGGQPDSVITYTWAPVDNIIEGNGTDTVRILMPSQDFNITVTATDVSIPGGCPKEVPAFVDVYEKVSSIDINLPDDVFNKQTGEGFLCGLTDERYEELSEVNSSINVPNPSDAVLEYSWFYRFDPVNNTPWDTLALNSLSADSILHMIKDVNGDHQFAFVVQNTRCIDDRDSVAQIFTITDPVAVNYDMADITICVEDDATAKVRNTALISPTNEEGRDGAVEYTWYLDEYRTLACLVDDSTGVILSNPDTIFGFSGQHQLALQYDTTTTRLDNGDLVRDDSLVLNERYYYPAYDSTSIDLVGGDVVGYDNYTFQAAFNDQVVVVADPQYCIIYDKDDVNAGENLLRDTLTVEVVSRPGAALTLYDLGVYDYSGTVTTFDLEDATLIEEGPYQINKIEDDFALLEVTTRSEDDYVFPEGVTDVTYEWGWYVTDDSLSTEGFVGSSDAPNLVRPVISTRPEEIKYQVLTDNGYCQDSATFIVTIGYLPWPPEAFSPNGDTFFDKWEIRNVDKYEGTEVRIFNRWGVELMTIENYNLEENWWDGTKDGNDLPTGTYFYWVDFKDGADPVTGAVSIVK